MQSMETIMGFDFSTPESTISKQKESRLPIYSYEDATALFVESIETLDYIMLCDQLINRSIEEKRRMISKLDAFNEKHLKNNPEEKHSVERYLNNCLLSMEKSFAATSGPAILERAGRLASIYSQPISKKVGFTVGRSLLKSGIRQSVGRGAVAATGGKALFRGLLGTLIASGIGTIIQQCRTCGNFEYGEDILKSPKCLDMIEKFKERVGEENLPSMAEVLANSRTIRTKAGFISWLLTGDISGTRLDKLNASMVCIRNVNGVVCAVVKLMPILNSLDLKQFAGMGVIVVTAMYKRGDKVRSTNLARGYLLRKGTINRGMAAQENFNYYMNDYIHGQEEIDDRWYLKYFTSSQEGAGKAAFHKPMTIEQLRKSKSYKKDLEKIRQWMKQKRLRNTTLEDIKNKVKSQSKAAKWATIYKNMILITMDGQTFSFSSDGFSQSAYMYGGVVGMGISAAYNKKKNRIVGRITGIGTDIHGDVHLYIPVIANIYMNADVVKDEMSF